jgi:hypothetical protein
MVVLEVAVHHTARVWQSRAAHIMVARKQRKREREKEKRECLS